MSPLRYENPHGTESHHGVPERADELSDWSVAK